MEKTVISLWRKIVVGFLALVGFFTSIKLAIIYYNANFLKDAPSSFCSINEFIDCDSVARTIDSQFLGVPLAYWGMFLYCFILLMMAAPYLSKLKIFKFLEVFKHPYSYIASLGIISFSISMILLCISLFQIKKLCILCAFTYILDLSIALFAIDYVKGGFVNIFKTSFFDFVDAVKIKKYLIAFIAVAIAAMGFLTYTAVSYKFAPQAKKIKCLKKFMKMNEKEGNIYAINGNILGEKDGKVKLDIYSDFRCPMCIVYNIVIHKVVEELNGVEVRHYDYPLDQACNKYLQTPFHQNSCVLSLYAHAAEKQGNYWGMASKLYYKQPMTDFDVWVIASDLGLDIDKLKQDVMDPALKDIILKNIDRAVGLKLKGTPAISIQGGEPIMGIMPDFELKEKLIKAGATEKKNDK